MVAVNLKSLVGKLGDAPRRALEGAAGLCLSRTNYNIEVEHWLLKMAEAADSDLAVVFKHYGVDAGRVSRDLIKALDRLKTGNSRAPALSPNVVDLARDAYLAASVEFGAPRARSAHVLFALLGDETFHRMAQRCERNGMPLFLLVADLDHFKDFVGRHGHLAGDSVLKGVARIMAINLRPHDLLVYAGGDKFAVLLPERSLDMAMKMAERLREAVAAPALHIHTSSAPQAANTTRTTQDEHVTVSLGLSAMQPGDTLASLWAAAAEALQQAKTDGRNQVRMAAARS
ncbi:MAG: diguanylate cyclase [Gallionella sp.]|nr:diguanylate cyclase [Gallionella sp.]